MSVVSQSTDQYRYRSQSLHFFLVYESPSTPGLAAVLVLKLTRGRGKKNKGQITCAVPIGNSFALSDKHLFAACHNVCDGNNDVLPEIGVVQTYSDRLVLSDIVVLTYEVHCSSRVDDWAVYKRSEGNFTHFALICAEMELPIKKVMISIKDYPVGFFTVGSVTNVTVDSYHAKVSNYQVFSDSVMPKKRLYSVVKKRPAAVVEGASSWR